VPALDTLFVTANLNAGGAQRSLVNLAGMIAQRHRLAIAVCGQTTHAAFARELDAHGVETFRVGSVADDAAIAESLLAHAAGRSARNLCFWNVAPGVRLLAARFAPPGLRIVDVSPGRYAFEELEQPKALAEAIGLDAPAYYHRIDALVLKHAEPRPPPARRIEVIPNGVAERAPCGRARVPRFLVSGRIAPSKHLETILAAFAGIERTHPAAELHVLGVAEPRHAEYAGRVQADASPGVRWRGAGFDLAHLDEAWTAAVVLGTHQGCPNAVLEAMAAAIPVIANASGGTGELVVHAQTGWLLPEDAGAEALAAAMLAAARDAEAALAMGRRGRRIAAERFGLEAMALGYLALLGAETPEARETIARCNSASARAAQPLWPSVPSPEMPGS
jgi:glycosyltransferase involved in cell wall biosynthesis